MAGIGLFRIFDPKVRRHLISDEGEVVIDEVRQHWVVYSVPMLEVVLAAALLVTMATTAIGGQPVLLAIVLVLCAHAFWQFLTHHRDRFVVTNMRVMRIRGVFSQTVATTPIARVLDITLQKPIIGRVFGYGHFVFESAAQDQGFREIKWVSRPDDRDLTIQRVIQRTGLRASASVDVLQAVVFETARRKQTRNALRPRAPTMSKRPLVRTADSGTISSTRTMSSRPRPRVIQNIVCQFAYCTTSVAAGIPNAAPTPRVELMIAIDGITRRGGSSSRRMLMPSGTTATAAPWNARPTISTVRFALIAQSNEPMTIEDSAISSTRRLPYMSPARPSSGVNTAPVSSVTVISQLTSDAGLWVIPGSSGRSGTTMVWLIETSTPQNASAARIRRG